MRARPAWVPVVIGHVWLIFAAACAPDPVDLVIDVRTDHVAGDEFVSVRVDVDRGAAMAMLEAVEGDDFLAALRVASFTSLEPGTRLVEVQLLAGDGSVVGRQAVVSDHRSDLALTVLISRGCADVMCPAADPAETACLAGMCVDPSCASESPPPGCPSPECVLDTDCVSAIPCELGSCAEGYCLYRAEDSLCALGETCKVDAGCNTCGVATDRSTVAHFRFDDDEASAIEDERGVHPGRVLGGEAIFGFGQALVCGSALKFPDAGNVYVVIDDSPEFDLSTGSVELWFWLAAGSLGTVQTLLSRDASASVQPGHFSLRVGRDNTVYARLQVETDGPNGSYACTAAQVTEETWHHVGVNFGPPDAEIWLDGVLGTRTVAFLDGTNMINCDRTHSAGITGNDEPWVLGADSGGTPAGPDLTGLRDFARGARFDDFRISSVRRDFSSFAP